MGVESEKNPCITCTKQKGVNEMFILLEPGMEIKFDNLKNFNSKFIKLETNEN
jgi:hypothetical protein